MKKIPNALFIIMFISTFAVLSIIGIIVIQFAYHINIIDYETLIVGMFASIGILVTVSTSIRELKKQ